MRETIEETFHGILKLLETIIIPDWGALIGLIPVGLLLVALGFLGRLAARWLALYLAQPDLPPSFRRAVPLTTTIWRRLALVPAGLVLMALAMTVLPRRVGPLPEVGWDIAVLILGIVLALAGTGLAVAASDAADDVAEHGPSSVRSPRAILRSWAAFVGRIPSTVRGVLGVSLGFAIVVVAFLLAGASPTPGTLPEVSIPLVLVGVLIGLASMGAAIRAWERAGDPEEAAPGGHAVIVAHGGPADHRPGGRTPGAFA